MKAYTSGNPDEHVFLVTKGSVHKARTGHHCPICMRSWREGDPNLPSGGKCDQPGCNGQPLQGKKEVIIPELQQETAADSTFVCLSGSTDRTILHRRRGDVSTFIFTEKEAQGFRTKRISRRQYNDYSAEADPNFKTVKLKTYMITQGDCRVAVEEVEAPVKCTLLRMPVDESHIADFPTWAAALGLKDVTAEKDKYSKKGLASSA